MSAWRAVVLVGVAAALGALGTFLVGVATGMGSGDIAHLATYVLPALVVTVVAMAIAGRVLARASLRQRFVAVGIVGAIVALANLWVLSRTMFVSEHDATLLGALLLYSAGAGVGAAIVLARGAGTAVDRLTDAARDMGDGRLDRRVGALDAGPELDALASTLDDMASRLEASHERERRSEATRRDLITAVSHDLRTPLASLRAMVEAIDDRVVDDRESLYRYVAEMRRSVARLVEMVDDLFELAQIDAGAIEAETSRARLVEVVRSAVSAVELQAEEKGLALVTALDGMEGVTCSPRLARVLQNLLVNAVRHTPVDGTVRVDARRLPHGVELAVADTGEGIAPEDLARVFEPFYRSDPARSGPGAGLGLALAKRIVEALGGTIRAESAPAQGSRFAVVLPT
ncbi:MAG TPA: HAMP domain-containing sensor histidine kinase [Actinomycetota bacterium]|nr:HAMP domain-containing sensor histidine kinase [Actinomycetota bacterium]